MAYARDPFVDTLQAKERAEEDVFFANRDRELLARLRAAAEAARREHVAEFSRGRCPDCGEALVAAEHHGVTVIACPAGHGMWLTESTLHVLARRERDSWIGRYFYRPRPVVTG